MRPAGNHFARILLCGWMTVLALGGVPGAAAQGFGLGEVSNFKVPDYYSTAHGAKTNAVRSLLTGAVARPRGLSGLIDIKGLKIEQFREDGQPEVMIQAPFCVFDSIHRTAWSSNRLQVLSGNGLSTIRGLGFYYQQTNGFLIISNQTETRLQRDLVYPRETSTNALPATRPPSGSASSNETVQILADQCTVLSQSNLVLYQGHVVTDHPQLELHCERMRVRFDPTRRLQDLLARDGVRIINKQDRSEATGGEASYSVAPGQEMVRLSDHPVWHNREGTQELRAEVFLLNPETRILRAQSNAVMRLPRGSFTQPDSPLARLSPAAAGPPGSPAASNEMVEVSAEFMTILLPSPQRASRAVLAETNVVILSPSDQSRATADQAAYTDAQGRLVLSGHAFWTTERMSVKADTMTVDRTNRTFSAEGHTWVRAPVQAFGRLLPTPSSGAARTPTNFFLEVTCDTLDYSTNQAIFRQKVHGVLFEAQTALGTLDCTNLTLHFGERLERALAQGQVLLDQPPTLRTNGTFLSRWLACESLTVLMATNGQVRELIAEHRVAARHTEQRAGRPAPRVTDLTCEKATATFAPNTNRLERLVGERNVMVSQGDKIGQGGRGVFDPLRRTIELTDHPRAQTPLGEIKEADLLIYDLDQEKFKVRGLISMEGEPPARTNRPPLHAPSRP